MYAAVRIIPKKRRSEWPSFLMLPAWATDEIEAPTMKEWTIFFQGIMGTKHVGWFVWRIWGYRTEKWKEIRQRLTERAAEFGLTCCYIYSAVRPMDRELYDMVVAINKEQEARP